MTTPIMPAAVLSMSQKLALKRSFKKHVGIANASLHQRFWQVGCWWPRTPAPGADDILMHSFLFPEFEPPEWPKSVQICDGGRAKWQHPLSTGVNRVATLNADSNLVIATQMELTADTDFQIGVDGRLRIRSTGRRSIKPGFVRAEIFGPTDVNLAGQVINIAPGKRLAVTGPQALAAAEDSRSLLARQTMHVKTGTRLLIWCTHKVWAGSRLIVSAREDGAYYTILSTRGSVRGARLGFEAYLETPAPPSIWQCSCGSEACPERHRLPAWAVEQGDGQAQTQLNQFVAAAVRGPFHGRGIRTHSFIESMYFGFLTDFPVALESSAGGTALREYRVHSDSFVRLRKVTNLAEWTCACATFAIDVTDLPGEIDRLCATVRWSTGTNMALEGKSIRFQAALPSGNVLPDPIVAISRDGIFNQEDRLSAPAKIVLSRATRGVLLTAHDEQRELRVEQPLPAHFVIAAASLILDRDVRIEGGPHTSFDINVTDIPGKVARLSATVQYSTVLEDQSIRLQAALPSGKAFSQPIVAISRDGVFDQEDRLGVPAKIVLSRTNRGVLLTAHDGQRELQIEQPLPTHFLIAAPSLVSDRGRMEGGRHTFNYPTECAVCRLPFDERWIQTRATGDAIALVNAVRDVFPAKSHQCLQCGNLFELHDKEYARRVNYKEFLNRAEERCPTLHVHLLQELKARAKADSLTALAQWMEEEVRKHGKCDACVADKMLPCWCPLGTVTHSEDQACLAKNTTRLHISSGQLIPLPDSKEPPGNGGMREFTNEDNEETDSDTGQGGSHDDASE